MLRSLGRATAGAGLLALATAAGAAPVATPSTSEPPAGHRTRILRTWHEEVIQNGRRLPARVEIVFDYTAGVVVERLVLPTKKGDRVLKSETFPPGVNVPGPTLEEIEEAKQIVRADPELARLIRNAQAELDGGFEIFEPEGSPCGPGTRCLKIQIDTADRLGLIRNVVVDLTKQALAYRAWAPEWTGGKK